MVGKSWRSRWNEVCPVLEYPPEIRKAIYTTNAIEALNRQLRRVLKTKGALPSDEAASMLLFLALRNAKKTWGGRTREWTPAFAQFTLFFGDRLTLSYCLVHKNLYILSSGDCPLAALTATRLLEFRAVLQAKKLSARTVNLLLALVRVILRFAASNGHITASATDRLGRGKLMLTVEKTKPAPPIATAAEVGLLLETIQAQRPDRFAFFATRIYTGVRKAEACGLRWQEVDLDRRIITIRRSYGGQTKSGSHREVPMPARLTAVLKAHKSTEPFQANLCSQTTAARCTRRT